MNDHWTDRWERTARWGKKKSVELGARRKGEVTMQLFRPRPHTWLPRLPQEWGRGKEGQDLSTGSSLWRLTQNPHSPPSALQTSASWPPDHACWSHDIGRPCWPRRHRPLCRSRAGRGHRGAAAWSLRWACARRSRLSHWSRGCLRPPALPRCPHSPPGPLMWEGVCMRRWCGITFVHTHQQMDRQTRSMHTENTVMCADTREHRTNRSHQCQGKIIKTKIKNTPSEYMLDGVEWTQPVGINHITCLASAQGQEQTMEWILCASSVLWAREMSLPDGEPHKDRR